MLILVVFVVLIFAGVWLYHGIARSSEGAELLGILLVLLGGFGALICVVSLPLARMGDRQYIQKIRALEETAANARESGDGLEAAAFRMKVVEVNQWIAAAKFSRTTIFRDWTDPSVDGLEPIR